MTTEREVAGGLAGLGPSVAERVGEGARFCGLFATDEADGTRLTAVVALDGKIEILEASVPAGRSTYPAITPHVPAASWYERDVHDLSGIVPAGHPRLRPLVLPLPDEVKARPRPGSRASVPPLDPDEHVLPSHVVGQGIFKIPYGPVRSGVFESIEYLVETPGEEILHIWTRVFYKHRGIQKRFEGLPPEDGALLAERVEGIASVAHAIAFCQAIEGLSEAVVSEPAKLVRTVHAELERVASHLDVAVRLTEAAGLAVAHARFAYHKEQVLRLIGAMCGSRFGRGVVIPGGVTRPWLLAPSEILRRIYRLEAEIRSDAEALMETESFLDRLRGTGPIDESVAREQSAVGPIGRASGLPTDARVERPYAAYGAIELLEPRIGTGGDALARLAVRWREVWDAFGIVETAVPLIHGTSGNDLRHWGGAGDGRSFGWAESPQGEVLYAVETRRGTIHRCWPRSASFHNLPLFALAFRGDILTDFAFIEGSFGLSAAGVAL